MKSFRNLTIAVISVLLLTLISCGNRTDTSSTRSIPQLQEQVRKDSVALQKLQERYQEPLRNDFLWCDSMLVFVPKNQLGDCFEKLNLAQAYLSQFNDMVPVMKRDIAYIQKQLASLQNDIDTHYISDSLAQIYLHDETASADTLHYRIIYFQDKLEQQSKELQSLKKTIRKVSKK